MSLLGCASLPQSERRCTTAATALPRFHQLEDFSMSRLRARCARLWERPLNRAWCRSCRPRLDRYRLPPGRTAQSLHGTESSVSTTIEGGKGFVVLVEKGGNLDFKRFRHRFPPRVVPFHIIVVHNDGQRCRCGSTCGTSAHVEGFGCRPIAAMRLAPWPASESLQ